MALRKLQKELGAFNKSEDRSITARPTSESDLFKWTCTVQGPEDSPYQGGTFIINITLDSSYPFKAPTVEFTNKVFHPNINENGKPCLDILGSDKWAPSSGIADVLRACQALLAGPTADSPVNQEAGSLLKTDKAKYDAMAKEWTQKYAM